jgi:hypothetical protein
MKQKTGAPTPCGGNARFPISPGDGGMENIFSILHPAPKPFVSSMSKICKNSDPEFGPTL